MTGKKIIEKLKEVEKLETATDIGDQVKFLQEIEAKLLNECFIRIGTITIEPLLVEAYYYHEEKFPDNTVHAAKKHGLVANQAHLRQQNNLNRLYIHRPKGDGIDICLTDSKEYYLSFLIKNACVDGEWMTQNQIAQTLCDSCGNCKEINNCDYNEEIVLYKKNPPRESKIIYLPRKGITGKFACVPLAALPLEDMVNPDYKFTLPSGYPKQWRVAVYALSKTGKNEEKARKYIKENKLFNYAIEEKYWMLAKETLNIK